MKCEHYFELKRTIPTIEPEALNIIGKIFEKHKDIICAESDFPDAEPTYSNWEIYFNGKGKDAKQAFCFPPPRNVKAYSCRTGRKNYDLVVCEVLMVLKHFYKNALRITTTSNYVGWHKAITEMREFLPTSRFLITKNNLRIINL